MEMIRATGTRYIIKAEALESMSAGGIFVRNTGETQMGVIVSVGPRIKDPLTVGDRVLLDWHCTLPVKHDNEDYFVVEQSAIHAVMEK